MKLFGLTFTYNESKMVPYVMPYIENMGFDKLIVYDNQSNDNTVELLKRYKFIEVRTLNTNGSKSNQAITDKKNSVWKEFIEYTKNEDVWMFISDFDEVIYKENFKKSLEILGKDDFNYLNQEMFETISDSFPNLNKKMLHNYVNIGKFWGDSLCGGCKMTLFKINDFEKINYVPGAHRVSVIMNKVAKSLSNCGFKSFHLKWIDKNYCLQRKNLANKRRGPNDIKHGYGKQYEINDKEFINKWNNLIKTSINIKDYLDNKNNGSDGLQRISIQYINNNSKKNITNDRVNNLLSSLGYYSSNKENKPKILTKNNIIRKFR